MYEQGSGMWTHRHLLPARVYFNDKNKFLFELWPTQCPVRITFSAGVCLCSDRDHLSPVSHCLSSQRLLQALLCSWCLQDLEQCQKENAKAWESMYSSNKWSLFTANSTKACLSYSLSSQKDTSPGWCVSLPNALHFMNETRISAQATIPLMVFRRNKASFWKQCLTLQAFPQ